jgi:hypothetical protein
MEITHEFFGREYEIVFDLKITAPACAATGPTYDCGGEPASPMEWEVDGEPDLFSLKFFDVTKWRLVGSEWKSATTKEWVRDQPLDMPGWLKEAVTEWLHDSDEVACMADDLVMREREYDDARF